MDGRMARWRLTGSWDHAESKKMSPTSHRSCVNRSDRKQKANVGSDALSVRYSVMATSIVKASLSSMASKPMDMIDAHVSRTKNRMSLSTKQTIRANLGENATGKRKSSSPSARQLFLLYRAFAQSLDLTSISHYGVGTASRNLTNFPVDPHDTVGQVLAENVNRPPLR